ncbi:MAG: hypothetical protein IPM29_13600 [Planctomycetes bacterium]|nr:hypothetical protein [Planctomycetota bacterium]
MRLPSLSFAALCLSVGLAPAQSITTLYAGGNSGTTTWTNQFDVTVLSPNGLVIVAFDVNCENTRAGGVGSPFTLDVWVTQVGGTYVGNEINANAWTHVATGSGVSGPIGTPTRVDVSDFVLAPGSYGMALEYNGTAMAYTNGNGANQTYSNADVRLDLGASTTGRFGAPVYSPRVWNGTLYYFAGTAFFLPFGEGCAGSAGRPTLAAGAGSRPALGGSFTVDIGNLPGIGVPVLVAIGYSNTMWGGNPLPFDLGVLGMTGCRLYVAPEVAVPTASPTTTASLTVNIPNIPLLAGRQLQYQAFVVEPGINPLSLIVSNAGTAWLGN